jgi:hypothetical protein
MLGYNNQAAYVFMAAWSVLGIALFAVLERRGLLPFGTPAAPVEPVGVGDGAGSFTWTRWAEIAVIALAMLVLHWPPFLAKEGPYYESVYFLGVMQRLDAGQLAYRDFEFSYGPVLLGLLRGWTRWLGFSMLGYFWLVAALETVQFAALGVVLQRLLPGFRARLAALLLLLPIFFNASLGLNYTAARWLLPLLAILLVAARPGAPATLVAAGVLTGVGVGYSHDVGAVGLVAVLGTYGILALRGAPCVWIMRAALLLSVSVATWTLCALLILGNTTADYFAAVLYQVSRRGAAGEYAFPFHWTLNALSVVALIGLACAVLGRGLARWRTGALEAGDRLLVAGMLFTLVAMKSGLSRADMAHLSTAMLGLLFAFTVPWPRRVFAYSQGMARAARVLLWMMVGTTALGWAPAV